MYNSFRILKRNYVFKVISLQNNKYDVRFFGGKHERVTVDEQFIKPIDFPKEEIIVSHKNKKTFDKAMDELLQHQLRVGKRTYGSVCNNVSTELPDETTTSDANINHNGNDSLNQSIDKLSPQSKILNQTREISINIVKMKRKRKATVTVQDNSFTAENNNKRPKLVTSSM